MLAEITFSEDDFYNALIRRDIQFEGKFIAGVKTTGIFCRPTCRARKPRRENVEFFSTTSEALRSGYRACKICKPLEVIEKTPDYISQLIQQIQENPSRRIQSYDLREMGIDPATIRRWFIRHHGITFSSFQRMQRINSAFKKISSGESITGAALDSGYNSLSGFQDSFKSIFGMTPSNSKQHRVVDFTRFDSPLGPMVACAVDEGICLVEFSDRRMLETELKDLAKHFNGPVIQGANKHFDVLQKQLAEYYKGERKVFDLPLVTPGSAFQLAVWKELQQIPFGATRSYKQQSLAMNQPKAIRAIAHANGMNRIAIIIPCHRVLGEDGSLTGYAGGLWRKKWLLEHEQSYKQLSLL